MSDIDMGPNAVLAHRYPGAPNLKDIIRIDWHALGHVDIMAGGFCCQSVSTAGRRAGLKRGTRTGLWFKLRGGHPHLPPGARRRRERRRTAVRPVRVRRGRPALAPTRRTPRKGRPVPLPHARHPRGRIHAARPVEGGGGHARGRLSEIRRRRPRPRRPDLRRMRPARLPDRRRAPLADATKLLNDTKGKMKDEKTRQTLDKAIRARDEQAITKAVKAVNDFRTAKEKADAEARAEQEAAAAQSSGANGSYSGSLGYSAGSYSGSQGYSYSGSAGSSVAGAVGGTASSNGGGSTSNGNGAASGGASSGMPYIPPTSSCSASITGACSTDDAGELWW